jgi:hypothetical protein
MFVIKKQSLQYSGELSVWGSSSTMSSALVAALAAAGDAAPAAAFAPLASSGDCQNVHVNPELSERA